LTVLVEVGSVNLLVIVLAAELVEVEELQVQV
jgi:hypothetical protein